MSAASQRILTVPEALRLFTAALLLTAAGSAYAMGSTYEAKPSGKAKATQAETDSAAGGDSELWTRSQTPDTPRADETSAGASAAVTGSVDTGSTGAIGVRTDVNAGAGLGTDLR